MRKVYSSPDIVMINHYKNLLENEGIACILKNYYLTGAAGELPTFASWPELWILADEHYETATKLLQQPATPSSGKAWACSTCGELIEPQFNICWNCGDSH